MLLISYNDWARWFDDFAPPEYAKATDINDHLARDPETMLARARAAAGRFFDVRDVGTKRYARL